MMADKPLTDTPSMKGKVWDDRDIETLLKALKEGKTTADCSHLLGRSKQSIQQRLLIIASQLFAGGHSLEEIVKITKLPNWEIKQRFTPRFIEGYRESAQDVQLQQDPKGKVDMLEAEVKRLGIALHKTLEELIKIKRRIDQIESGATQFGQLPSLIDRPVPDLIDFSMTKQ